MKRHFPHLNHDQRYAVWAVYWGLCLAPFVDDGVIEVGVKMLIQGVEGAK